MKLCATIVEDRGSNYVIKAIGRHERFLPADTEWIAWVSQDTCYENKGKIGDCTLMPLLEKMTIDKYNELLTTPEFWDFYTQYDRVLVFQSDGGMLKSGIEEFYPWDYVGAPWKFQIHGANGGESLRNPKIMKRICEDTKYQYHIHGPEDTYFSNLMHDRNFGNLAPREVCSKFGVESEFSMGTMFYHAIEKYLTPDQCKQIYEQYN